MAEFKLEATTPLAGYSRDFGDIRIAEITDFSLFSLAIPLGKDLKNDPAFEKALKTSCKLAMPEIGRSVKDGKRRFMRLQQDLLFVQLFTDNTNTPVQLPESLAKTCYVTEQTGNWTALQITGQKSGAALERLCKLDLHDKSFAVGDVARTSLEHMNSLILRETSQTWLLMSAASSAKSFLHAVETSVHNIL